VFLRHGPTAYACAPPLCRQECDKQLGERRLAVMALMVESGFPGLACGATVRLAC